MAEMERAERRFVIDGEYVLPCMVLEPGRRRTRVAIFKPYEGTKVKRVRHRNLLSLEEGRTWLAWRKDPMADVPTTGELSR